MNNETGLAAKKFDHATYFPPLFCKAGSATDGGGAGVAQLKYSPGFTRFPLEEK